MLVEHRVDDVDERLVAIEETVAAGEQVTLQPSLAHVLAEDFHDAAVRAEMIVTGHDLRVPCPVGRVQHRAEPVRDRLVGPHDPKVVRVALHHVSQVGAQDSSRLA